MEEMLKNYYLNEEGYELLLSENGFLAYRIGNGALYIGHVFINKVERGKGLAGEFMEQLTTIAKDNNCPILLADIFINEFNKGNYTKKLNSMLAKGFEIIDVSERCITIKKELNHVTKIL